MCQTIDYKQTNSSPKRFLRPKLEQGQPVEHTEQMGSKLVLFGFLVVVPAIFDAAAAETYTVGDEMGWTTPPSGAAAYSTWASKKKFHFGDTIVFNWTGSHSVAEVSKADYDKCRTKSPDGEIHETSPANYTLNSNGTHYFICTVDSHCDRGQKVTINIGGEHSSASSLAATFFTLLVSLLSSYI
ncbi:stellacyanin [Citrus clementina]|uniref:stellacyanin n=1 Tax=Citrus clementina TaxID=85681 RepID=UPI000CED10CB|nr:stellacyanin [Citrus x clementina]